MKKRQPQSQRKNIPKSIYQGNIIKKNNNNTNTFRQTKDYKLLSNTKNKKTIQKSHKDSPKIIDYIQVMNKYSHLIDQNSGTSAKMEEIDDKNNYYLKTDYNQDKDKDKDKNKDMKNILHYNNSYNNNTISNNNKINNNDNYFKFCKTDYDKIRKEEDKNNNFKYYTLKNFYQKKKNPSGINSDKNKYDNKSKPFYFENNKNNNNPLMTYANNSNNLKNREYKYKKFLNNNNYYQNNNKLYNTNIHNSVSLKKMSKAKTSSNSHSLNNINRTNNYFNRNDNNSLSYDMFNNKPGTAKEIKTNLLNYKYLSEKLNSFINLCKKYATILNNSINYIELNNNNIYNHIETFDELKYIIIQYNKFIFSEKIDNFFNIKINNNNINYLSNINLNEFEPNTLNLTEKFRSKIKNLNYEKSEIIDELKKFKKKNKNLILEKEKLDLINKKLVKENQELNIQIKNLKNFENKCYHQNNMIDKLKCQIETLNIDIKYKENIITNLQQILEQIKIKAHFINNNNTSDSDNIKINTNKNNNQDIITNNKKEILKELGNEYNINGINNNISDFLLDVNSESIEKDIILPLNLKVNSIEYTNSINMENADKKKNENGSETIINYKEETQNNIKQLKQDLKEKNENSNNINRKSKLFFSNIEEPEILTKEMEKIDQDILNLKTKLKKIITK